METLKKIKNLSFLLFAMLIANVYLAGAQTIITGTVNDSLNKPIPFATVYLLQTTIGTITGEDGIYQLKVPQQGHYQIIASCIGYRSDGMKIDVNRSNQIIDFKLLVNDIKLSQVTIDASEQNKKRFYNLFVSQFIGESSNAKQCKILNPEDLHVYNDRDNDVLKGFSVKPLKIENNSLGYTVVCDLIEYSYNSKTKTFKYKGIHYFQSQQGKSTQIKKWNNNRLKAYYGSSMHFLRALFSDSLDSENFKLYYSDSYGVDEVNYSINRDEIVTLNNPAFKKSYSIKPITIIYSNIHNRFKAYDKFESSLEYNDTITIYQNGMFYDSYALIWQGSMANDRISDMLPFDYHPDNLNESEKIKHKDQVFVQTDRNLYSPGDTIHFQAYIRNALTGELESGSASLYAMLFNEQQEIADSSRFRVLGSTSTGWLAIPQKATLGKYRLLAYTGMMQNDDPGNAFQLDLKVDSKLVDPETASVEFNKEYYVPGDTIEATVKITTYKKHPIENKKVIVSLKNENNFKEVDKSRTNNDGEAIVRFVVPKSGKNNYQLQVEFNKNTNRLYFSKNFNIPYRSKYIDFSLLPEGGTLIEGRKQRIGFNAVNASGQTISVVGLLKEKTGQLIDTIQSGKYGPGLFTCLPQSGMYIELTNDDYEKKIWPLPSFSEEDVCMSVNPSNAESIVVSLQSARYKGNEYCIAGFMNNLQYFLHNFKLNKKESFALSTIEIPTGAMQIMLLDKEMKPIAQRMVYVNENKRLKFNISCDISTYFPGQETELTVNVTDSLENPEEGIFSISAVNYIAGIDPETFVPNIEYSFNYSPYFTKNLPPKVLIDGLENIGDKGLDLLLMVYGWSKIKSDSIKKERVNFEVVNMKLLYTSKSRLNKRQIDLIPLEGLNTRHLFTDKKGEISFPLDSLDENARTIIVTPAKEPNKKLRGMEISIPFNKEYFKNSLNANPFPYLTKEENKLQNQLSLFKVSDSITAIPEVLIKGYVKREFNDEYEKIYQMHNTRSVAYEKLWIESDLLAAIKKRTFVYHKRDTLFELENTITIVRPEAPHFEYLPALIVLDGTPLRIDAGWAMVRNILPRLIKSVTIVKDMGGYYTYGPDALGGVIFVTTRPYDDPEYDKRFFDWSMRNNKDMMYKPFNIYRYNVQFYNPTRNEIATNPQFHDRPTIYWNPLVYFDGKKPVKIKFPNNFMQGPVMVTINGVSANNLVGSGKLIYWVQN